MSNVMTVDEAAAYLANLSAHPESPDQFPPAMEPVLPEPPQGRQAHLPRRAVPEGRCASPTFQDLESLAAEYGSALLVELDNQTNAADLKAAAERVKCRILDAAYLNGVIDGKNAEIRSAQERALLAGTLPGTPPQAPPFGAGVPAAFLESIGDYAALRLEYADDMESARAEEYEAGLAIVERKRLEAHIGLVKAWLYAQSGSHQ